MYKTLQETAGSVCTGTHVRTWIAACLFLMVVQAVPFAKLAADDLEAPSAQELVAWSDEVFRKATADDQFLSLGIAIVDTKGGLYSRAYGAMRAHPFVTATPDETRYLIGSITKTMVGVAIARLVEEGQINSIDDPANRYLKRASLAPSDFGTITVRHLLTHSAGFESITSNIGQSENGDLVQLPLSAEEVENISPGQVRDPGQVVSYSNYSTGLLALLIEDLTRQPIEDYLRSTIWQPLGMASARFHKGYAPDQTMASPYKLEKGVWQLGRVLRFHPFYLPVGGVVLTPEDMGRYAAFHLKASLGASNGVLSSASYKDFANPHETLGHKRLGTIGFKIVALDWNGQKVLNHSGTWPGYQSMLLVFPQQELGVMFTLTGSAGMNRNDITAMIVEKVLGRYQVPYAEKSMATSEMNPFIGLYLPAGRTRIHFEALYGLFGGNMEPVRVTAADRGLFIGGKGPYLPVGEGLFWSEHEQRNARKAFPTGLVSFSSSESGSVWLHETRDLSPLEKVSYWETVAPWRYAYVIFVGLATILALASMVVLLRVRRAETLTLLGFTLCVVGVAAFWLIPIVLTGGLGADDLVFDILAGEHARLRYVEVLFVFGLFATLAAGVASFRIRRSSSMLAGVGLMQLLLLGSASLVLLRFNILGGVL